MPTSKLTIEYDGTRYRGWQAQKNTERTVQGMLLRAAEELLGEKVSIGGAGRTDAGVHALAQVAHLRCRRVLPLAAMEAGLNDRLPHDVNVLFAEEAPAGFHARHDAAARVYLYRISRRRSAFDKRYVWWVRDRLDAPRMAEAAGLFCERRDFASFAENAEGQDSTVVVVEESAVREHGDEIHYRIRAAHFLWKMVRRLVGTLVEVGRGNLEMGGVERLLREKSADPARWTAPPSGLFLEEVIYPAAKEPPRRTRSRG
ncbi:MAG: tRNA pseudouridine(38-40) synthase TruA [Thermoanaerobaculia bacterium]